MNRDRTISDTLRAAFTAAEQAEHRRERELIEQEFPPGKAQVPPDDPSHPPTLGDDFDLRWLVSQLRQAREAQGLSLGDIQNRTQIDRAALSRIESGQNVNPTIGTLARYARAIGKRIALELTEPTATANEAGQRGAKKS